MRQVLLAGTTKGLFTITSDAARSDWQVAGPFCDGWPINHAIGRGARIWAAGGGPWQGAGVWRFDGSWSLSKLAGGELDAWAAQDAGFAAQMGVDPSVPLPYSGTLDALWSLGWAGDRLYAGGKPGKLYVSEDAGENWAPVPALNGFEGREDWHGGAAGMTLHTIVSDAEDPAKLWLGISAAGVFASEDGGQSFERRNRRANASAQGAGVDPSDPAAPKPGETGHCVHNMVRGGGILYQQNHRGVWRSRDDGRSWENIGAGLPSDFGFPIAVHPHDPQMIWCFPLNGDDKGRFPPDAAAAVWRSCDGGTTWEPCRNGLPQKACFFTVLRQSMTVDQSAAPGVYFGTNSGSVFGSFDTGDSWTEIARHLPTILSLEIQRPLA